MCGVAYSVGNADDAALQRARTHVLLALLAGASFVAILALSFAEFIDGGNGTEVRVLVFMLGVLFDFAQAALFIVLAEAGTGMPGVNALLMILAANVCTVSWIAVMLRTNLPGFGTFLSLFGFGLFVYGFGDYFARNWHTVPWPAWVLVVAAAALLMLMALASAEDSPLLARAGSSLGVLEPFP